MYCHDVCYRLQRVDEPGAAAALAAVEGKVALLLRCLGDEDDDVSAAVASFTTDYISLLKQLPALSQAHRDSIQV